VPDGGTTIAGSNGTPAATTDIDYTSGVGAPAGDGKVVIYWSL
jgi:hypothetical protein